MSWRKGSYSVTEDGGAPRLVEGEPVLDSVSEAGEAEPGVVDKVGEYVLLGEEPAVPVVQLGRDVPVVLGEERREVFQL